MFSCSKIFLGDHFPYFSICSGNPEINIPSQDNGVKMNESYFRPSSNIMGPPLPSVPQGVDMDLVFGNSAIGRHGHSLGPLYKESNLQ